MTLKSSMIRLFMLLTALMFIGQSAFAQNYAAPPSLPSSLPAADVINHFKRINLDAEFRLTMPNGQVVTSRAGDLLSQGVLLSQVDLGRYHLEVRAPGYDTATYTLTLKSDMMVVLESQSVPSNNPPPVQPPPAQPTPKPPVAPPVNPGGNPPVQPPVNPVNPVNPVQPPPVVIVLPTLTPQPSPVPVTSLSIAHNLGQRADIQLALTLPSGQVFTALSGDFPAGNIAIDHLQAGDYRLSANVPGYLPLTQSFRLEIGQQMGLLLEFIPDPLAVADNPEGLASLEGRITLQGDAEGRMVTLSLHRADTATQSEQVPVNSAFTLDALVPGELILEAHAEGYLSRRIRLTLSAAQTEQLPPVVLTAGDVNQDNVIDLLDITLIAANFNGPAPFPALDVNGDGWIDIQDLSLVGRQYGLAGPLDWAD